jgi:hypothetical protein
VHETNIFLLSMNVEDYDVSKLTSRFKIVSLYMSIHCDKVAVSWEMLHRKHGVVLKTGV